MDLEQRDMLQKIANTIRQLSIESIQKANSGHPGLPLGCAEIGAYLYGHLLNHNPANPRWSQRDRFILSAGHGSMLLYSCLHLAGFNLSIEDLKNFRQLGSKTPGHPEIHETDGVEATTGPLGQGVANAVGQALGLKILQEKFSTEKFPLYQNKVYALAGDGCIMEGVSCEASSLAGHLNLNNLVLIYDANNICLDGPLSECCSEDTKKRYESYGFQTYEIEDGNDLTAIHATFSKFEEKQERPVLVVLRTKIGKGSPNKEGTHKVHGAPLGEDEVTLTKKALGLSEEPFFVGGDVRSFFEGKVTKQAEKEAKWKRDFENWEQNDPERFKLFNQMAGKELNIGGNLDEILAEVEIDSPMAGRKASHIVLQKLGKILPSLVGGSADLSCSDLTMMGNLGVVAPNNFDGRNIKFGVREFGMAAAANGLAQTGMFVPYIGTFCTFSDYMRNAIRLAALSETQVIYQFTHDSIFLGEDGPTHQPVEHYMSLRTIPKLHVFRPADNNEVKMAWVAALRYRKGPSAIILTRQGLPELEGTSVPYQEGVGKGAYIVKKESGKPEYTLFATGSEVTLAIDVAQELEKRGHPTRVISMPCWEIFEKQSPEYINSIVGGDLGKRISLEAGVSLGWHKWIGRDGIAVSVDEFGKSAPIKELKDVYGFTVEAVLDRIL